MTRKRSIEATGKSLRTTRRFPHRQRLDSEETSHKHHYEIETQSLDTK